METLRGERNIWKRDSGDKLLEEIEGLELSIDGEEEGDSGNPYDRSSVARRR